MQNIKDLAASSAKTWGEIAQAIDDNFKGTTDPQESELKWLRAIDKNGDPMLISAEDHAKVVGELIGNATPKKDGLMSKFFAACDKTINTNVAKITIRVINSGFSYILTGYKNHQLGTSTLLLNGYKDGIDAKFLNRGNKIFSMSYTRTVTTETDVTIEIYLKIDTYSNIATTTLAISNDTYVSIEEYNGEIPSDAVEVSLE